MASELGVGSGEQAGQQELLGALKDLEKSRDVLIDRLLAVAESRALAASPSQATFLRLLRNDPVLIREVDDWQNTVDTYMKPYVETLPIGDKEFAEALPQLQESIRSMRTFMDSLLEMYSSPEKFAESVNEVMEQLANSPDFEEKAKEAVELFENEEFVEQIFDNMRAMGVTDEAELKQMRDIFNSPETKNQIRELFSDPEQMKELMQQFGQMPGLAMGAEDPSKLQNHRRRRHVEL